MPLRLRGTSEDEIADIKPRHQRAWWGLAALAVATLSLVMVYVSRSATAPRTPWDEIALFQLARVFSGEDAVSPTLSGGYYPLTSMLIAPLYWFTHDAATVYGWANLITNVAALATVIPLALIARRLGLTSPQAIIAASITMLMPAYTGLADYVLTEQLLGLLVVLTVHAALRFWERPGIGSGVWTAAAAFLTLLTHARAAVLIGVLAIWLVGLLFDRTRRRHALWLLALLVVPTMAVMELGGRLASLATVGGFSQGGAVLDNLSDPNPVALIKAAFLETWATNTGTLGIFAFGVAVVGVWAFRELVRERRFGPGVLILGVALGGSALSWVNWATVTGFSYPDGPRFDTWIYTRYIAPFVLVAILVGVSALMRRVSLSLAAIGAGITLVLSLVVIYVFADTVPIWGSTHGPGNIAALRAWEDMWPDEPHDIPLTPTLTNSNQFWVIASIVVIAVQAALVAIRRFRITLAVVLIALFGVHAALANPTLVRSYPANIEDGIERIEATTGEPLELISFDIECSTGPTARPTALNWSGFWLAPRGLDLFYPSTEDPASDVVIACNDWPLGADADAQPLPDSSNYGFQVWVLPGAIQDDLEVAGAFDEP